MTNTIIDRIRDNEPELKEVCLDLSPESYCSHASDIIAALACNRVVQSVRFGGEFLPGLCTANNLALLAAVGRIPSLRRVRFDRVGAQALLRVDHLGVLVNRARKLTVLDIEVAELKGDQKDFAEFEASLYRHPALERFVLKDVAVVSDSSEDPSCCPFHRIVRVLGTIPNLSVVELEASGSDVAFSGLSLTRLLTSSEKLVRLRISRFRLDQLSANRVAHAVNTIPTLKSLALPHTGLDNLGATKIASALEHDPSNGGNMDLLDLSFNEIGTKGCLVLAKALSKGSKKQRCGGGGSVRVVSLEGNKNIGTAGWAALAAAVASHDVDGQPRTKKMESKRLDDDDDCVGQRQHSMNLIDLFMKGGSVAAA